MFSQLGRTLDIGMFLYCPDPLITPKVEKLVGGKDLLHLPVAGGIPPKQCLIGYLKGSGYPLDRVILIASHYRECHAMAEMGVSHERATELGKKMVNFLDKSGYRAMYFDMDPKRIVPPYYIEGGKWEGKMREISEILTEEASGSQMGLSFNPVSKVVVTGFRNKPAKRGEFVINAPLHDDRGYAALASAIAARAAQGKKPTLTIEESVYEPMQPFWRELLTKTHPVCAG